MISKFFFGFFFFVLVSSFNGYAQTTKTVKDITGTAFISGDVSPNRAKIDALNDAKINALKKAGIEEHINSYQMLFTSQVKNDYTQFFNSDIQSEIQGAVKSYQIKKERVFINNDNVIVSEVIIDAVVIKYDSKPDVTFDAMIEGIKGVYNNDDKLRFTVKTTQDCYLTVFNITDKDASVLFPNDYEKQKIIHASTSCCFPVSQIDYTLHTDMKQQETNRLIFVFTKTQIPFIKMDKQQVATQENIFNWIYTIMPNQRKIEYKTLLIQK